MVVAMNPLGVTGKAVRAGLLIFVFRKRGYRYGDNAGHGTVIAPGSACAFQGCLITHKSKVC